MTSPSDLDLSSSVNVSTQTIGETIHQFVDLPGLPSIQERIIHTQDDQVKKSLADLGWISPQEAKAMRADLSAKDAEIANLKRGPTPDYTGEGSAWTPPNAEDPNHPEIPVGWVLGFPDRNQQFRYWCKDEKDGGAWKTTDHSCATVRDLMIVPDPSVQYGAGYEPIILSEAYDLDGYEGFLVKSEMVAEGWYPIGWILPKKLPSIPLRRKIRKIPGAAGLAAKVQEIQAGSVSSVDRFASCSKNEPCTPAGCEAGQGNWPRCPTEAGAVKAPPTDFPSQAYTSIETAKLRELEAQAVVVPEPTSQQWINEVLDPAYLEGEPFAVIRYATKWFRKRLRAIPADRVLGEGMMAVDRNLVMAYEDLRKWAIHCGFEGQIMDRLDALRANQGGTAT